MYYPFFSTEATHLRSDSGLKLSRKVFLFRGEKKSSVFRHSRVGAPRGVLARRSRRIASGIEGEVLLLTPPHRSDHDVDHHDDLCPTPPPVK